MISGTCDRDMWFWKIFTNAIILARGGPSFLRVSDQVREAAQKLPRLIKAWSQATGVVRWQEAKQALQRVVWFPNGPEALARRTWEWNVA